MSAKGYFKTHCIRGHPRTRESVHSNGTCKVCNNALTTARRKADPEQARAAGRKFREENPDIFRDATRKHRYSISKQTYDGMMLGQSGLCKICGVVFSKDTTPCTDHDHNCCPSNKACEKCIRGLLCKWCNLGLGYFKDNPESLLKAAEYLKK